jgi:hypothetical protein
MQKGVMFLQTLSVCLLLATLSGCIGTVKPESFASNTPVFLPEQFFAGNTRGAGILQANDGAPAKQISVTSYGRMLPDGRFQLEQTISQSTPGLPGVETTRRTWLMSKVDGPRYTATLTDAAGPVTAEAHGNLFHLKYLFKKPFVTMEQWLYLQADGRTVLNEARVYIPGRTLARLSEIIVRQEESQSGAARGEEGIVAAGSGIVELEPRGSAYVSDRAPGRCAASTSENQCLPRRDAIAYRAGTETRGKRSGG